MNDGKIKRSEPGTVWKWMKGGARGRSGEGRPAGRNAEKSDWKKRGKAPHLAFKVQRNPDRSTNSREKQNEASRPTTCSPDAPKHRVATWDMFLFNFLSKFYGFEKCLPIGKNMLFFEYFYMSNIVEIFRNILHWKWMHFSWKIHKIHLSLEYFEYWKKLKTEIFC